MLKKGLMTSLALVAFVAVGTQAEGMKCAAGKCGGMTKPTVKTMPKGHMRKHSPFLIRHGLPHLTKMVAKHWDDKALALTETQKNALLEIRKETMSAIKSLKPQIVRLTKEIVKASKEGASAASLEEKVKKLAALEADATMAQLRCIEKTKAVLKPEQLSYLMAHRKAHIAEMKAKKAAMMKCAAGKCGGNK